MCTNQEITMIPNSFFHPDSSGVFFFCFKYALLYWTWWACFWGHLQVDTQGNAVFNMYHMFHYAECTHNIQPMFTADNITCKYYQKCSNLLIPINFLANICKTDIVLIILCSPKMQEWLIEQSNSKSVQFESFWQNSIFQYSYFKPVEGTICIWLLLFNIAEEFLSADEPPRLLWWEVRLS